MRLYGSISRFGNNSSTGSSSIGNGSNVRASIKNTKKENWPVVSARVPPELRRELLKKYKKRGELSALIYDLLALHVQP
jgi:hypothetical protein